MTPTQLRTYVAIVRNGTSKAAAVELGVSEAAVSGQVASLRRELDDVLFERSASGLRFTPGGLRLATRAVELLGLQDQTRQEVRTAAGGRRVLRLAVSSLFGEYAAPGLIELFSDRARDLDIEMSVHPPGRLGALLASRVTDAAIGPHLRLLPDDVVSREFLRYQLIIVTAPGHHLAGRRVRPEELAEATWFLGPSAVDENGLTWQLLKRFGVPEANQRIFQSHAAAIIDAGRRGHPDGHGRQSGTRQGVALAPAHYVAADLAAGRLVRVDTPGNQMDGVWSVMTLPRSQAAPVAAELVRFVTTPRAIQAMLSGSGANISHFKPSVHITIWS
ncbi:MAG: LysR family transcriptional regulator [Actinomycetia bacterium]|nr:LysR family transcriptional regulator [Actinomycetes bacterium]MCP5034968.1 LysR family transcriptional regulator [Actinomycetes bacterium]